ncbi:MAG TPA: imidazolonepropionase [Gemmatimonadales bacterium]|nr:imidazolonepropionase [Gemmatimonadales bacterium]
MRVLRNIGLLATCRAEGGQGDIHVIERAAIVWQDDTILWVGREDELPLVHETAESEDCHGRLVIPGLVDCHTHLAFGGWRAGEFERRLRGESYLDIAQSGGGIASTVRATRAASEEELVSRAKAALAEMRQLGVTTVECKSGYGLDEPTERKLLRVYRRLRLEQPTRLVATFLGAHVVPPEFRDRRDDYVRWLVDEMIPAVARERLAECCDVFVERSAFTLDEARCILEAGRRHGLGAKLHADQLSDGGGAALAAELGALSADHLEHVSPAGIAAMAAAGTVAVSLPFATLYLREPPMPARALIDAGVPVAVATDFNPGSAPSYHLPMAMTLACTMQRMTPAEVLKGATVYAARAIGMEREVGSLEAGKRADFAVIDAPDVTHWLYHLRPNACVHTVVDGLTRWNR